MARSIWSSYPDLSRTSSFHFGESRVWCAKGLASFSRLILFDKRGTGMSDRTSRVSTMERMEDIRAVMDAAGSERAVVHGLSEGAPLSCLSQLAIRNEHGR